MLRFFFFVLLSVALTTGTQAQKEDNIWLFGYDSNKYPQYPGVDGIIFNFSDSLSIAYQARSMPLDATCASICDSSGHLLLISNGCYIETSAGQYVENSDGLNPGFANDDWCVKDSVGYPSQQSMMLLHLAESSPLYYLFHISTKVVFNPFDAYDYNLFYTVIDVSQNNGSGRVIEKSRPIVTDTLHNDGLAAVRHANGRDWWIVVAKQFSNKYYVVLLSPSGLTVQEQSIGVPTWSQSGGEMVFSPDGSKMGRFDTKDDLRIFDFDRCTGQLSNAQYIEIHDNADNEIYAGLAFSADGHYLYAAEVKRLLQFDMLAPDIAASQVIVAERENFNCPFSPALAYLELGPDGRIYGRNLNGSYCMHRMLHPERAGTACELRQNELNFGIYAYTNLPHFPNFRLGPVDGSACDSLGLDNHPLAGWRYDRSGGLGVDFTSVSWYEPTAWSWSFGDGSGGSAERNPAHTFPAAGPYEVCLTVSNPYGSDTKCKTVWVGTVAAGEPWAEAGKVVLYPNPTTGLLRWTGTEGQPLTIRVLDPLGRVQLEQSNESGQIDLSRLPTGLYLVQLRTGDGVILTTQKVSLLKP